MRALLFAAGEIKSYDAIKERTSGFDMVICCDGGLAHAHALGITPRFIAGDLDSVDEELLRLYEARNVEIVPFPVHKDETDLELALELAVSEGASDIVVMGAGGGRFDHALTNVHVLKKAMDAGVPASIVCEDFTVRLINREIIVHGTKGKLLSLIPLTTEAEGVTTEGLYYPLNDETLYIGKGRGLSNVFTGETARVSVRAGILIVIEMD